MVQKKLAGHNYHFFWHKRTIFQLIIPPFVIALCTGHSFPVSVCHSFFFFFYKPYRLIRSAPEGTHLALQSGLARKRTTLHNPSL